MQHGKEIQQDIFSEHILARFDMGNASDNIFARIFKCLSDVCRLGKAGLIRVASEATSTFVVAAFERRTPKVCSLMEIASELQRARRDGVTRPENLPFLLSPEGASRGGVILVHGFTASPWEMRELGEFLAAEGYLCLGIRLPGHGTRPEDLLHRRFEEWQEEVSSACRRLSGGSLPVYGVGMSTGGLLLAAAECSWDGLVLLSPYLRLRHRLAPFACLIRFFHRYQETPMDSENAPFYYRRRPVNGVCQLIRLARKVRGRAGRVTAPVLLVSAEGDETVRVESARELLGLLGSGRKEYHLLGPDVSHILTTSENPRRRETFFLILNFLRSLGTTSTGPRRVY